VPDPASGPPTKSVTGPDGLQIHYPSLPNVGEPYLPPSATAHEVQGQRSAQPPTQSPTRSLTNESWRERVMNAPRSVVERVGLYGRAAVNALVLDDWKALTDAHSSTLQRVEGGASLASWAIPEGKVAEIAGHALAKAGELAAAHVAEQSAEHTIASGVEHAAEHTQEAGVAGRKWAERTPNQKLADQHPMNKSTIWDRPLTPAERGGAFKNADDLTAFEGPATERGGVKREWHHPVESQTAARFGPERVHNIKNAMAIEKDPVHRNISKRFQSNDESLGLDANGDKRSLRTSLKDKPWEDHVDEGRRALNREAGLLRAQGRELRAKGDELGAQSFERRAQDLDPDRALEATAKRHEQRLELHDRLQELSKGHEAADISHGRGTLGVIVHQDQSQSGDRSKASVTQARHEQPHPELHIFHDGQSQTVGVGHHQTGKIFNCGALIGIEDDASPQRGLTMYPRQELFDLTPPEKRPALALALRDGNTLEIGIGSKGVAVHVTAVHQMSPELERSRAIQQHQGRGLEL